MKYIFEWWDNSSCECEFFIFELETYEPIEKINELIKIVLKDDINILRVTDLYDFIKDYIAYHGIDIEFLDDYCLNKDEKEEIYNVFVTNDTKKSEFTKEFFNNHLEIMVNLFKEGVFTKGTIYEASSYYDVIEEIYKIENFYAFTWDIELNPDKYNTCSDGFHKYYVSESESVSYFTYKNNICKMDMSSGMNMKLSDNSATYICYFRDNIYYVNPDKLSQIYSIKIDGSNECLFCEKSAAYIQAYDGWIYFCNRNDNRRLYRISISDKIMECLSEESIVDKYCTYEKELYLSIKDGWIYYQDSENEFWRIRINGNEKEKITDKLNEFKNILSSEET